MRLNEGRFHRAFSRIHLPRPISVIMPFPYFSTGILRNKRGMDLVYRSLSRWIFIWNSSRFVENFLHCSMKSLNYICLNPGRSAGVEKLDMADKGGRAAKPKDIPLEKIVQKSILFGSMQKLSLASIPASMRSMQESKLAKPALVLSSLDTVLPRRDESPHWEIAKKPGKDVPFEPGRGPVRPTLVFPAQAIMQHRTDEEHPSRIIKRAEMDVPYDTNRGVARPTLVLSSQAVLQHRMDEGFPRATTKRTEADVPYDINRGQVKPTLVFPSLATMQHRTDEEPPSVIIKRHKTDVPFDASRGLARPTFILSSQAILQHRMNEGFPRAISKRPEKDVPYDTNRGLARPALVLCSMHHRTDEGHPRMIGQKPEVEAPFDLSAKTDLQGAQIIWANSRMSARPPPAEMEYAPYLHTSIKREIGSEDEGPKQDARPPSIDIGRLSDQVCSIIERRLKIDRERCGVYA